MTSIWTSRTQNVIIYQLETDNKKEIIYIDKTPPKPKTYKSKLH